MLLIEEHRTELVMALSILLPKLAAGWARQRGDMFQFGESADKDCSMKVADFDKNKLKGAPISNLAAERSVGSISYELTVRGSKELKAASSAHVKGKAASLLTGKAMDKRFFQLTKRDGPIHTIMKKWEENQKALKTEGLDSKAVANIAADKQRNADLGKLTELGGPFTSPQSVSEYLENRGIPEREKNQRLYLEVRHAKNSSLSFPKASEVFRLKRGCRNLDTETYGKNLIAYLKRITCHIDMGYSDFQQALVKLSV